MRTFATLFTGGGLADIGIQAAGYEPLWGVEYDPEKWGSDVADWAKTQLRSNIIAENILNLYPGYMDRPDHLHASPPCPSFSTANNKRGETENDLALARKVAEFIDVLRPSTFTLENVYMYRKSQSWQIIKAALDSSGYTHEYEHVNFADLGVPQTRKRMIVRATLSGGLAPLPDPESWKGWYQAIEDLIPELPETTLANWQKDRLVAAIEKGKIFQDAIFIGGANKSKSFLDFAVKNRKSIPGVKSGEEPLNTVPKDVPTNDAGRFILVGQGNWSLPKPSGQPADSVISNSNQTGIRAILVGDHYSGDPLPDGGRIPLNRAGQEPSFTVVASKGAGKTRGVFLEDCTVKKITPRCLARFQTLPDEYELPEKKSLAVTTIGNGVPCLGMQKIMETFDDNTDRPRQISMFTT